MLVKWGQKGDWQFRAHQRLIRAAVLWLTYGAPLVCRVVGHQPSGYSRLLTFRHELICARCCRAVRASEVSR